MSMTAEARTAGESAFWSLFVPKARIARSSAPLKTPSAAASAFWKRKSQPWSASASAAAFAPATSSNEPVKTGCAVPPGCPATKPASKARNVDLIEGSSTPPTMPALPVFVIRPDDEAAQVRRLLELEDDGREVRRRARAGRRHEDRLRVLLRDARGGVLELEAVAEHEPRVLRRVGAELLLEFRRRLHLHVRDGRAQLLLDRLETVVGARVPAGVRDRARASGARR